MAVAGLAADGQLCASAASAHPSSRRTHVSQGRQLLHQKGSMVKIVLAALLAIGCSGVLSDPCSADVLMPQTAAIVAECKARRASECKGYDVLDECPLIQECDARLEKVGASCP